MNALTGRILRSIAFYPLTGTYLGGVAALMLVASKNVPLSTGLLLFAVVVLLMLMYAMHREVHTVHAATDAALERIDTLVKALIDAHVVVPDEQASALRRYGRRAADKSST